ncbi:MAG: carotenoid oxygenase family protein, partial [Candidatus Methylomirabilis sp.]|nr:carotenoid oxygenase family protein [Deltaproteobacteria bacterium]
MTEDSARIANLYRSGPFAPVEREIAREDLPVIGELPEGLDGLFVRNGANPRFEPIGTYHWFDGDAMLHGVRL